MRPAIVTAFEYEVLPVGNDEDAVLRPHEASRLLALGRLRPGFCVAGDGNVKLAQYAGLVNLGERMLEVLPKVGDDDAGFGRSRGTLLRMLRLTGALPPFSSGNASHDYYRQPLLAIFISAFLDEVAHLVRGGLLRRYRSTDSDLRVVRGRLQVARQATRHGMRPDLLACTFDEFSADNSWNQVLISALMKVRPWIGDVGDARRWFEIASAFDGISPRRDALSLLALLTPGRQTRRYAAAVRWAELVLRLLSPNVRAGHLDAPECLFDMNRLFESSVSEVLRRKGRGSGLQVSTQERGSFLAQVAEGDRSPMFQLVPDLVVRNAEGVVAVGDTKWSLVTTNARSWLAPDRAHAYQMHAYSSAFPGCDLYLIYPWHAGLENARPTSLRMPSSDGSEVCLHVVCLDVAEEGFPPKLGYASWRRLGG